MRPENISRSKAVMSGNQQDQPWQRTDGGATMLIQRGSKARSGDEIEGGAKILSLSTRRLKG
jgi:hypothetical protein